MDIIYDFIHYNNIKPQLFEIPKPILSRSPHIYYKTMNELTTKSEMYDKYLEENTQTVECTALNNDNIILDIETFGADHVFSVFNENYMCNTRDIKRTGSFDEYMQYNNNEVYSYPENYKNKKIYYETGTYISSKSNNTIYNHNDIESQIYTNDTVE